MRGLTDEATRARVLITGTDVHLQMHSFAFAWQQLPYSEFHDSWRRPAERTVGGVFGIDLGRKMASHGIYLLSNICFWPMTHGLNTNMCHCRLLHLPTAPKTRRAAKIPIIHTDRRKGASGGPPYKHTAVRVLKKLSHLFSPFLCQQRLAGSAPIRK